MAPGKRGNRESCMILRWAGYNAIASYFAVFRFFSEQKGKFFEEMQKNCVLPLVKVEKRYIV